MALFKDLFSKKKENPNKAPETQNELIRVYDNYGREIQISREDWRNNVLLGNLQKAWDKPNELYDLIVSALRDGFIEDTLKPSKRLYEIDPDKERATVILGIVYLQNDQINKAENILSEYIKTQGESGIVLTNLAKVYAAQKKEDLSRQTLWHALELDPNQDNAVEWYASIFHEEGGFKKYQEALSRLTQISGSWRAQLWLARNHLENKDLESAIVLYKESLGNAETPTPIDLLKQMSGDLGNNGHLPAILELCAPSFDPAFHGLEVGNNLIKANLDLGCIVGFRMH